MEHEIDEIDLIILKSLLSNARTNFVDIAKECQVSITTIQNRFNKLKNAAIIKGTHFVTKQKADYEYSMAAELTVEQEDIQQVIKTLKTIPNFTNAYPVIGKFDIHAIFHIKNFDEIKRIRSELSKNKGVKDIKIVASNQIFAMFPNNLFKNLGKN